MNCDYHEVVNHSEERISSLMHEAEKVSLVHQLTASRKHCRPNATIFKRFGILLSKGRQHLDNHYAATHYYMMRHHTHVR